MERYRNFVRLEQLKENIRSGRQTDALEIAEMLDLKKIRNSSDINLIADLYIENGMYERAYEALREVYSRKPGRTVLMQLINLTLTLKNTKAAERFYSEFHELAPNDYYNHIYRYNIDKLEKKSLDVLIEDLETLKKAEYIDVWAYELAKLYHKSGLGAKCVKECKDIEVWFGDGEYVERAKALRAYYRGELDLSGEEVGKRSGKSADDEEVSGAEDAAESEETAGFGEGEEEAEETGADETAEFSWDDEAAEETGADETAGSSWDDEAAEETGADETAESSWDDEAAEETGADETAESSWDDEAAEETGADETAGSSWDDETVEAAEAAGTEESGKPYGEEDHGSDNTDAYGEKEEAELGEDEEKAAADEAAESSGVDETKGETGINEAAEDTVIGDIEKTDGEEFKKSELAGEDYYEEGPDGVSDVTARIMQLSLADMLAGKKKKNSEPADDFAEEMRDYDEADAIEKVDINLKNELPEGDEAVISGMIEQGMTDLAMQVNAELEKEHADEEKWKKTRLEYKEKKENANKPSSNNKSVEVAVYEPEKKPIDKSSLLGQFLNKRGEQLENYYGFLCYHPQVGPQLVKTLEILLNPQIKNICLAVTGADDKELDIVIKGTAKAMYSSGYLKQKQILKTYAEKLDAADLEKKIGKLLGSCFVIRQAGSLKPEVAAKLLGINDKLLGHTVVVLTDEKSRMNNLFRDNRELNSMFPQRIHIPEVEERDIIDFMRYTVHAEGYLLEKEAVPEIEKIARGLHGKTGAISLAESKVAEIIDRVETRNARLFMNRGDSTKAFKSSNIILKGDTALND